MTGRQSVVVDARKIIMPSLEFSTNPEKDVNQRKVQSQCVGQPTNSVCPCEYGEDLIEENDNFLSRTPVTRSMGRGHFNFPIGENEIREEEAHSATRSAQ
jgi:hypothetical protein